MSSAKAVEFADPALQAGFTQVPNCILRDPSLSAGARVTYALLSSFAWQDDECWVGQKKLGMLAGVGDRMIRNYLDELEEAALIEIHRQGQNKPNRYVLFGSGQERNCGSGQERKHSSAEEDTGEEDSKAKRVEPKKGEPRPKVGGKLVTDQELSLATAIIAAFNEAAGTSLTVLPHLTPVVMRIRERPTLTAAQHGKIIEAVFAAEHWWTDPPGPRIIYGNAAQFEQSIELARQAHKAASGAGTVDVNARRKEIRRRQGLDQGEAPE